MDLQKQKQKQKNGESGLGLYSRGGGGRDANDKARKNNEIIKREKSIKRETKKKVGRFG